MKKSSCIISLILLLSIFLVVPAYSATTFVWKCHNRYLGNECNAIVISPNMPAVFSCSANGAWGQQGKHSWQKIGQGDARTNFVFQCTKIHHWVACYEFRITSGSPSTYGCIAAGKHNWNLVNQGPAGKKYTWECMHYVNNRPCTARYASATVPGVSGCGSFLFTNRRHSFRVR